MTVLQQRRMTQTLPVLGLTHPLRDISNALLCANKQNIGIRQPHRHNNTPNVVNHLVISQVRELLQHIIQNYEVYVRSLQGFTNRSRVNTRTVVEILRTLACCHLYVIRLLQIRRKTPTAVAHLLKLFQFVPRLFQSRRNVQSTEVMLPMHEICQQSKAKCRFQVPSGANYRRMVAFTEYIKPFLVHLAGFDVFSRFYVHKTLHCLVYELF